MRSINQPENKIKMPKIHAIIYGLLVIFIAIQIVVIWNGYASWWGEKIWEVRDLPAWERAGRLPLYFGDEYTEYITWLRATVPEDGTILVPPMSWRHPGPDLRWVERYMIFPRKVVICGEFINSCTEQAIESGWWILAVQGFPPKDVIRDDMFLISYNDDYGVYEPAPLDSQDK